MFKKKIVIKKHRVIFIFEILYTPIYCISTTTTTKPQQNITKHQELFCIEKLFPMSALIIQNYKIKISFYHMDNFCPC